MLATTKAIRVINKLRDEGVISKYAIGGAVGALFYIEPTQTEGIDVFIHLEAGPGALLITTEPITEHLRGMGYVSWSGDKLVIEGWPVQFLPAGTVLEQEAIDRAVGMPVGEGVLAAVPPAEYLMAIAINLGRPKDVVRLYQFHAWSAYEPAKLAALLAQHGLVAKWERMLQLFQSQEETP